MLDSQILLETDLHSALGFWLLTDNWKTVSVCQIHLEYRLLSKLSKNRDIQLEQDKVL